VYVTGPTTGKRSVGTLLFALAPAAQVSAAANTAR
jgi:hypothetical protein